MSEGQNKKRKLLATMVLGAAAVAIAVLSMGEARMFPKEPRTRMPSLYRTFYSRMLPREFRAQFRMPKELFEFILEQLTMPRPGFPKGALESRFVKI